jgi:hypothetical protein
MKRFTPPPLLGLALALLPVALTAADTTMVPGPNLSGGRMSHSALVTPQGKVVLLGGHGPGFASLATADSWQAGAEAWTASSMQSPHDAPAFARLADGTYFIAGGSSSLGIPAYDTIETFDPTTGNFYTGGKTLVRFRAASGSAQLAGGKVLLAGAWWNHNDAHTVGDLHDPATGVSVATGPLSLARSGAVVLPKADGDAVVVGGISPTGSALKATPELYSVANNAFTKLGDELWADDPGWSVGPSFSSVVAVEDLRLADGHRFLLPMTRPVEGKSEQGYVLFDSRSGAFTRLVTTPPLPDSQAESFLYNPMIDRANGVAYVFSYLPGFTPTRALIRTINLTTGATAALPGTIEFPADYEISGASLSLLPDGRILVAGGATPGNGNFGARANTFLITPGTPVTPGPTVTLDTYAGVTVAGNVGTSYLVEYATALAPEVWLPLSSVTLTNTVQLVIDPSPLSGQAKRFYRAKLAN